MRKIVRTINKRACYFGGIVVCVLMVLTVIDVIMRNFFLSPVPGMFELTQIMLCVIVFTGMAYAHDNHDTVVIDLLYDALPRVGKVVFSLISTIILITLNALLTWYVFRLVVQQFERGAFTSTLEIPWWIISAIAGCGMALFTLSAICNLIFIIKDKGVLSIDAG